MILYSGIGPGREAYCADRAVPRRWRVYIRPIVTKRSNLNARVFKPSVGAFISQYNIINNLAKRDYCRHPAAAPLQTIGSGTRLRRRRCCRYYIRTEENTKKYRV